jgi:FkbM family methyltransferase
MVSIVSRITARLRRLAALTLSPLYCWLYGLMKIGPCYFVRNTLNNQSIVLDCGLGNDADFSGALITRYGVHCHGVDPTRKHQPALAAIAAKYGSLFRLHQLAVAGRGGFVTFYESIDQVSGSVFEGHVNAAHSTSYSVPSMTIGDLMASIGAATVDVLKLDIEGAEYEVLAGMDDRTFAKIGQLVVEFHHHCVKGVTRDDTNRAVARLDGLGYRRYSVDGINYLFFRPGSA